LSTLNPRLIYCSISGFGQEGPYARLPGYDFIAQAMGGLMSVTGEPDGTPMKAGVALTDIMTGLYACSGILAALLQRQATGRGQHVTTCLLDVQIATLANQASGYFATNSNPRRLGNAHPSIVPYQSFETADGVIAIGVGNDSQFRKLCHVLERSELGSDARFETNAGRVANREALIPILAGLFRTRAKTCWIDCLSALGIPVGPVNTVADVFADAHVRHRQIEIAMPHSTLGSVSGVACPVRLSDSPPAVNRGPPVLDEHGAEIRLQLKG
jgi:crotonobetainyl-CoA:carnitine CoA-transferase CaiB-like acyl-CoA transferase